MKKDLNISLIRQIMEEIIPFNRWLGIRLLHIEWGETLLEIPFREEFVGDPRVNRLHGGVVATLLDSAGGAAAMTTLTSKRDQIATVDLRIDYMRPAGAFPIQARGKMIYNGDRIVFTHMVAFQEEENRPIAEARGVYHVVRLKM